MLSDFLGKIMLGDSRLAVVGRTMAAVAVVAFAWELLASVQAGAYRMIPVGEVWFNVHVASLNALQAVIQRYVHPLLWDPAIVTVLQWPAWSLLGAPAAVLIAIAPQRKA